MRASSPFGLRSGILTVAFLLASGAQAGLDDLQTFDSEHVYVDGDYGGVAGPSDGSRARPFTTIQAAVGLAAVPSPITRFTTVHVDRSASPYVGPIRIAYGDLLLVGDNWNEGGAARPRIARSSTPSGPTLRVDRDQSNVTIQSFEIEIGAGAGNRARGTAIRVAPGCSEVTLRDLIVRGANPAARTVVRGILVNGSSNVTIEHCLFTGIDHVDAQDEKRIRVVAIQNSFDVTVQNCEFTQIGQTSDVFAFVHLFAGIQLVGGSGHIIRNNLFHDLTFVANDFYGTGADPSSTGGDIAMISGQDSEYLTVVNNTVADIDATGLQANFTAKNLRSIYVTDTQNADIRNNLLAYVDWVPGGFDGFFCHYHFCPGINACDPDDPPIVDYTAVTEDWEDDYWPDSMQGVGSLALDTDEAIEPVFIDRANDDYGLVSDSRCVDAGDPAISDADGSVSDLGCFGGPRGALPVGIF
jgi:hypothetical protein